MIHNIDANRVGQLIGQASMPTPDPINTRQTDLPLQERQNPEPVVAYLAAKHAERHNLTVTFPRTWAHFNRPEFLENVALSVSVL